MPRVPSNNSTTTTGKAEDSRSDWTDMQTLEVVTKVALVPSAEASVVEVAIKVAMAAAEVDLEEVVVDSEVDLAAALAMVDAVDSQEEALMAAAMLVAILAAHRSLLPRMHSLTLLPAAASEAV